jgi:hypothetical protein
LRVDRERLGPAGKPDQNLAREVAPNDKGLRLTRRFRSDHDAIAGPDVSATAVAAGEKLRPQVRHRTLAVPAWTNVSGRFEPTRSTAMLSLLSTRVVMGGDD